MKNILVINGVNLNFLGKREPEIYGDETLETINNFVKSKFDSVDVSIAFFQSNIEGEIVNKLQESYDTIDGIVINAGAFTHYSVAIMDAIKSVDILTVEVHLSNIYKREEFRHKSFISPVSTATICGMGKNGYVYAIKYLLEVIQGA